MDDIKVFLFTYQDDQSELLEFLNMNGVTVLEEVEDVDFIIAVGGDGTILSAKAISIFYDKPIVGYNAGTLGFLSCDNDIVNIINSLRTREYVTQSKKLLRASIDTIMPVMPTSWALNDLVIENYDRGSLANIDVHVENTNENISYHADKLIFSTATGSTAYNLSAGGSILHPDINGLIITPVAPFSMSARSIVVPDTYKLVISSPHDLFIKIDGRGDYRINTQKNKLNIVYDGKLNLVKTNDAFLDIITSKLNWNTQIKK